MVEITSEENKVKRMKRAQNSLRDLWDNIKRTSIRILGVPEEEEKKERYEKFFEEIIVENFLNMEKQIYKTLSTNLTLYKVYTTTGPSLGGQKPKGRKNSTLKPGKRRP